MSPARVDASTHASPVPRPPTGSAAGLASASGDRPEEPMLLGSGARREVERVRRPGCGAVAERDRPETVERDRCAVGSTQLTLVDPLGAALGVRADTTVAEVPDEEIAAEGSEVGRGERESPWRVERRVLLAAVDDVCDELAVRGELVYVRLARERHVVMSGSVLLGVGHEDVASESLDPERREALGDRGIAEAARRVDQAEGRIEDVDASVVEVGRVKTVVCGREPLVDGTEVRPVGADQANGGVNRRRPAENRPTFGREEKARRAAGTALADREVGGAAVEDGSGRPTGHRDRERRLRTGAAVEGRHV